MDPLDRRSLLLGMAGVAGACLAGASLAGCSAGTSPAPPTGTATSAPTASPSPTVDSRPRWPLTGALLKDPALARHAAVAVKVPDNQGEHPQVGLDQADIVFVELDGYRDQSGNSGTRLVPVFHSTLAQNAAPVRSIRPVDVPLLSPIGVVIGNTGAAGWVLNYVKHYSQYVEGMWSYLATRGTGSYSIDQSRVRTYLGQTYYDRAVVCHPKVLAKQPSKFRGGPQQAYFPFASSDAEVSTVSGAGARTIRVPWHRGDSYDMGYGYDEKSGRYLRSMPWGKHVLADGTRVAPDNVLVILAKQRYAKIYPGSGHEEPIQEIIDATGTFHYAHGGKYVTGTWTKGPVNEVFQFTLADGSALKMAPGQTFVELPRDTATVRFTA